MRLFRAVARVSLVLPLLATPVLAQEQTFPPPAVQGEPDLPPLEVGPGQLPIEVLIALGLEPIALEKDAATLPRGARWWIRQPDGRRLLVSGAAVAARAESPVFLRPVLPATAATRRAKVDRLGVEDTVIAAVRPIRAGQRFHYAAVPVPGYVVEGVWHVAADRSLTWMPATGVVTLKTGEVLVPDVVPQAAAMAPVAHAQPWIADPVVPPTPVRRPVVRRARPVAAAPIPPTAPMTASPAPAVTPAPTPAPESPPTGRPTPVAPAPVTTPAPVRPTGATLSPARPGGASVVPVAPVTAPGAAR